MRISRGLNVIKIGEQEFLLTRGNGSAVHLTRESSPGAGGRPPFHDWTMDPRQNRGRLLRELYDLDALTEPRWVETTLCGRQWISMVTSEEDDPVYGRTVAAVPTCRRCLARMDKLFPEPALDSRFLLIAELVTDTVVEYGMAEILGVPGDQQAALRKKVRVSVRKRTGHGMETYAHGSMVVFACQAIYDQHADEYRRQAAEAMNALFTGEPVQRQASPTRLFWDTWAAGQAG